MPEFGGWSKKEFSNESAPFMVFPVLYCGNNRPVAMIPGLLYAGLVTGDKSIQEEVVEIIKKNSAKFECESTEDLESIWHFLITEKLKDNR